MQALVWKHAARGETLALQALLSHAHIDPNKGAPLFVATERGHASCVEALLDHMETDPNAAGEHGVASLHMASRRGDLACLVALLSHPDIDPNLASHNGATPLHIAIHCGHVNCVAALLLHARTDPNKARYGATPLHEAVYHCRRGGATVARNLEIMKRVLEHPRTEPNLPDSEGYAPLHVAVLHLLQEGVRALLAHPAIDPNREVCDDTTARRHRGGFTPLHLSLSVYGWVPRARATDAEYTACVAALLAHPGTQPDKLDAEGKSPLHTAIGNCRAGAVGLLLNHPGVNVNRPCLVYRDWGNSVPHPPLHAVIVRRWHYEERAALCRELAQQRGDAADVEAPLMAQPTVLTVFNTMLEHERVDIGGAYEFVLQKMQELDGRSFSSAFEDMAAAVCDENEKRRRWLLRAAWIRQGVRKKIKT